MCSKKLCCHYWLMGKDEDLNKYSWINKFILWPLFEMTFPSIPGEILPPSLKTLGKHSLLCEAFPDFMSFTLHRSGFSCDYEELWRGISARVQGNIGARKGQLGWKCQEGLQVCIWSLYTGLGVATKAGNWGSVNNKVSEGKPPDWSEKWTQTTNWRETSKPMTK